jgi:acyl-CoA thioesterase-1
MSRVIGTLLALLTLLAMPGAPSVAAASDGSQRPPSHRPVVLVFGDSLSAGYGVPVEQDWVSQLARKLAMEGYDYEVVNASVSGETTAGGLERLPRALALHRPQTVILELGANDGLRALPITDAATNLAQMIMLAQAAGARVLLLGMRLPPNYGERYTDAFYAMYAELARTHAVALVPFFMAGVALNPTLIQSDGLHPDAAAQPLLLANVWPKLRPLLGSAATSQRP